MLDVVLKEDIDNAPTVVNENLTTERLAKGLQLIEDNLTQFDEVFDKSGCHGFGEWIDVHEVLTEAIEILKGE